MIPRLLFLLCTGWFLFVMGLLAIGAVTYPREVTDEEIGFSLVLAVAPPFVIAGAVRVVKWTLTGK